MLSAPSAAQAPPVAATESAQPSIDALAERVAAKLKASNKNKILIGDLRLPDETACELGVWLADELSNSLAKFHLEFEVIPRLQWRATATPKSPAHDRNEENGRKQERARSLGAEVLVQGNFAAVPNGIGITLTGNDLTGEKSRFEVLGEIPLTREMRERLTSPLPERKLVEGSYPASTAGIGSPVCVQCPPPEYTYIARARKLSGLVLLQLSVSPEGSAAGIRIVRKANSALTDAAVRTVSSWQFKPATDAGGRAVTATVDVAISFRAGMTGNAKSRTSPGNADAATRSSSARQAPASPLP